MPDWRFLLKVSRPRFWLYVLGPYLVGLAAGAAAADDLVRLEVLFFGLYFMLPANLLIYGVNDIFDFETDKLNPKKQEYEALVRPAKHRELAAAVLVLNIPFVLAAFLTNGTGRIAITGFVLLSVFYSAWPIRAKAIPVVDSMFNILYVLPGIFAFGLVVGSLPPVLSIGAAFLWTMAMHAYSAIPDIQADRDAGIETIATLLGREGTLFFCSACYLVSAVFAFPYLGPFAGVLGLIYLTLMGASLFTRQTGGVYRIYRYFPLVNSACGFMLFWYVAIENLIRRG